MIKRGPRCVEIGVFVNGPYTMADNSRIKQPGKYFISPIPAGPPTESDIKIKDADKTSNSIVPMQEKEDGDKKKKK